MKNPEDSDRAHQPAGDEITRRDYRTFLLLVLGFWILYGAIEQRPFALQGAMLEALVERGQFYFVHGVMHDSLFENRDTKTPQFRYILNVFQYAGIFRINNAPGQFFLAAPWYALCVKAGLRFENHYQTVWRILLWTLIAPLGALTVGCLFLLARLWGIPRIAAMLVPAAIGLASPWWPASGVLYHDSVAVALIVIGGTLWLHSVDRHNLAGMFGIAASGMMLGFAVVTTYLAVPIVLLVTGSMIVSRPSLAQIGGLMAGVIPTLAILPITNAVVFGSVLATGYSAGGFHENYPAIFDYMNAFEKARFYLWNPQYGLVMLFPVFALGGAGLLLNGPMRPRIRTFLIALAAAHFLLIISFRHHGSVGWGMGRFFLPLFGILSFGLPSLFLLDGWKGVAARFGIVSTMVVSFFHALAGVWYGVQGTMEPGLPSLKMVIHALHPTAYKMLPFVAIMAGVLVEGIRVLRRAASKD